MVYEFIGKIKNINPEGFNQEAVAVCISQIEANIKKPMDEVRVLKDSKINDVLVKAQISVSSYQSYHDEELLAAIDVFKVYVEKIAAAFKGEVSRDEGFYNNSKTFHKLLW